MKKLLLLIILFLGFGIFIGFSQSNFDLDSLKIEFKKNPSDINKLPILSGIVELENNENVWPKYNILMQKLAKKIILSTTNETDKKIAYKFLSESYNNEGFLAINKGNIPLAIEFYNKSLKINEKNGDKLAIAVNLLNLGHLFSSQGDEDKNLEYLERSYKLFLEVGVKKRAALALNNIGSIYSEMGDTSKAIECFSKSIKICEDANDKFIKGLNLGNMAYIYSKAGDNEKALTVSFNSLSIFTELKSTVSIAKVQNIIGSIYLTLKNYSEAEKYFLEAYKTSKEISQPSITEISSKGLRDVYENKKNYLLAYQFFKEQIIMRDSINNEKNYKETIQQKSQYEYEKKAATDSLKNATKNEIKNAQIAKQKSELKVKKNQQYALIGGIAMVVVFSGFIYNRLKKTQQQKLVIESQKVIVEQQKEFVEKQKETIEEKQEEILASIRYAKKIQDAIITSHRYIERNISRLKN